MIEFLAHARAIRDERALAGREGREPRIIELLQGWGGATIAYRRRLIDSPSYTLNHEEVEKAMEEGIRFSEGLTPTRIDQDATGHAERIHFKNAEGAAVSFPARAVLVAAGTRPNTVSVRHSGPRVVSPPIRRRLHATAI